MSASRRQQFRATVEWLPASEGGRRVPPTGLGPPYVAPARFGEWRGDSPDAADFNLVVRMDSKSHEFRWDATIEFKVDDAPHERLRPGAKFELYEGRRCVARGIVLNKVSTA